MPRYTLFLSAEGLSAYRKEGKAWICAEQFTDAPEDLTRFAAFLRTQQGTTFQLLADLHGEEMLLESIPLVSGKDRQALIQRKLEQHFPATTLRTATALGKEKASSLRETIALSAFSRPDAFAPWLTEIAHQNTRLRGIFSTRQLAAQLFPQTDKKDIARLLFIKHRQMLSQHLLIHGKVHFSRSVVSNGDDIRLENEAAKLQHYLLNQRSIERSETLPVHIISDTPGSFENTGTLLFQPLKTEKELVFLYLDALDDKAPKVQFAPANLLRPAQLAQTRKIATAFALCGLFIALPSSITKLLAVQNLHQESSDLQEKTRLLETQLSQQLHRESSGNLRQLIEQHEELLRKKANPQAAFSQLSHVLDRHPAIQLEKLDWQVGDGLETLIVEGSAPNESAAAQTIVDDFLADLTVDRSKQVLLRQPLFEPGSEFSLRGNSTQLTPEKPRNFIFEIRSKP